MYSNVESNSIPSNNKMTIVDQINHDIDGFYKSPKDYVAILINAKKCIISCLDEGFQPIINARFFFTMGQTCTTIEVKDNQMLPEADGLLLVESPYKVISGIYGYGPKKDYVRIKSKKLEETPVSETILGIIQKESSVIILGFDPSTQKIIFGDIFSGEQSAENFNVLSAHLAAPLQTEETKDIVEKSETANPVTDE